MKNLARNISFSMMIFLAACQTEVSSGLETKPDYEQAYKDYVTLGARYIQRGSYDLAEPKLKRAIDINPEPPEAWNMLAILYEQVGDAYLANKTYQTLISNHDNYLLGYSNYATFLCSFNRDEDRLNLYKKMSEKGQSFKVLAYISDGDCLAARGNFVVAKKAYRDALNVDPKAAGALLPLAEISINQKHYNEALDYLDTIHKYVGYTPKSVRLAIIASRATKNKLLEAKMTKIMKTNYFDSEEIELLGL